jgi:REP element-mobilizing transposase RayT
MPRRPRLDHPGALHHITARGIERRALFVDDYDRRSFVRSMERVFADTGTRCLAWALMTNHVHLLVETGAVPISTAMQRLLTRHAMRFNRRHARVGHLFQNRFRSDRVASERHLLSAIRYVHLNPVEAGIVPGVTALETYPWTGHAALMGARPNRFQDVDGAMALVDAVGSRARESMRAFVAAGVGVTMFPRPDPDDPPLMISGRARYEARTFGLRGLVARSRYIDGAVRALDSREVRRAAARRVGWTLDRVIADVCRRCGADPGHLAAGRRFPRVRRARVVVAYIACEFLGVTQSAVARRVGVTQPAIPPCMRRGPVEAAQLFGNLAKTMRSAPSELPSRVCAVGGTRRAEKVMK